jgi:Xaa-Pro aminopeptidase
MAPACLIARETMAAVTPHVVPGVSMTDARRARRARALVRGSRCPSFPTHIFTWGERRLDSGGRATSTRCATARSSSSTSARSGLGYCSDFGRTVPCGEPSAEYEGIELVLLEAQEAGRAAARPGALARDVNAACRAPIESAGLGDGFRHRMGHWDRARRARAAVPLGRGRDAARGRA